MQDPLTRCGFRREKWFRNLGGVGGNKRRRKTRRSRLTGYQKREVRSSVPQKKRKSLSLSRGRLESGGRKEAVDV